MFTLDEELFMLSIHEDKGTAIKTAVDNLAPGLIGAFLAELALNGKIQSSSNHRLKLVDSSHTGIKILDEVLGLLKGAEKEHKFGYWIDDLNQRTWKTRRRVTENLIDKGAFRQDDERLIWVVPSPLQPDISASTKFLIIKRLRDIVLAQYQFETRDLVLLSLVKACDLLELVFLRDELKIAERFVREQLYSQAMAVSVMQSVQEIEAAVAAIAEED